ncbi:MFS transporter [Novosphingobium sp. KN65.2]|uniref:MFS transporter n=1 Tax=Novosphingobium sp. KN65.2 TaxID=1478134 RepID=UPI0005E61A5F|nr:MFS transporter [Novosphingobium sp. KN65.2]CDO35888.1 putative Uncharacterized transporter yebQ [Novosphingobium sp. KN65.2]
MNAEKDGLPMPRRLLAISAVSFGQALCIMDGSVANIVLPTIASDLRVDNSAVVLVVTIYQLVLVMGLLPLSALGDKIGHNRLYRLGLLLFSIATGLCFFAHNLPLLLAIRALQALGAAAVLSVSMAIVKAIYPAHQLGRGLALNTIVGASAAALAPTLGGFILGVAPWPFVFVIGAPLGIISLLLDKALPPSEPKGGTYDLWGALLCAAMFGLTIVGIEYANQGGALKGAAAIVVAGLLVGYFFVRRERGRTRPLMPIDLLSQPQLALPTAGAALIYTGFTILIVMLPFQLQLAHGFSPMEVGTLMASMPIASFFVAPVAGILSDRIRPDRLALFGSLISVMSVAALAQVPADARQLDILWRLVLLGMGVSFFTAPNTRMFIGAVPHDRTAAASGLIATTRLMGQTLGATAAATLLALGFNESLISHMTVVILLLLAGATCTARASTSKIQDNVAVLTR